MPPSHRGVKANSRRLTDDTLEVGGAFRDNFAMCDSATVPVRGSRRSDEPRRRGRSWGMHHCVEGLACPSDGS